MLLPRRRSGAAALLSAARDETMGDASGTEALSLHALSGMAGNLKCGRSFRRPHTVKRSTGIYRGRNGPITRAAPLYLRQAGCLPAPTVLGMIIPLQARQGRRGGRGGALPCVARFGGGAIRTIQQGLACYAANASFAARLSGCRAQCPIRPCRPEKAACRKDSRPSREGAGSAKCRRRRHPASQAATAHASRAPAATSQGPQPLWRQPRASPTNAMPRSIHCRANAWDHSSAMRGPSRSGCRHETMAGGSWGSRARPTQGGAASKATGGR